MKQTSILCEYAARAGAVWACIKHDVSSAVKVIFKMSIEEKTQLFYNMSFLAD
jgi:hypothetical protein